MILLNVRLETPRGEQFHVGYIACGDADSQGWYRSQFAYSQEWISKGRASFDLVPRGLEREKYGEKTPAQSRNFDPPLAVFEDAAPDTWGRNLLVRVRNMPPGERSLPYFLREIGSDGLGALSFGVGGNSIAPRVARTPKTTLGQLLGAAEDFESGRVGDLTAEMERLLMAGATPGGARPKALVHDEQGVGWIAKFPSVKDVEGAPQRGAKRWDIVGLEATGMALARGAGLDVADTRIETAGSKRVLLVRRFDISAEGGRNHMVSFKTLCGERNGVYVTSYSELFAQVLDASCRPKADVEMLYRHMVVNAAIGNTDDHLKNFWMLRDEDGWKLSPAIDLVPAGLNRREHQLSFLHHYDCPSGRDLIAIARQWRIKPSKAREIVEEVADAAGLFESTARTHGVDEDNIPLIWNDVRRRREVLLKDLPA